MTLDAHRYFGFYELGENEDSSVVHWRNLTMDESYERLEE